MIFSLEILPKIKWWQEPIKLIKKVTLVTIDKCYYYNINNITRYNLKFP